MTSLKSALQWYLKAGLPDSYPNLVDLSRLRTINLCTSLVAIVAAPFIFKYKSMGVDIMAWGIAFALAIAFGNLVLLRRTRRVYLCGHIAVLDFYLILVLSNAVSGGFYDPNLSLFYSVPLAAGFAMGRYALLLYFFLISITILVFFSLPYYGIEVPNLIPKEEHAVQSLANRFSALCTIGALGFAFLYQRSEAQKLLLSARDSQVAAALQKKELELSRETHQLKDEFLATVSHGLRTPLNGIMGMHEIIKDQNIDADVQQNLSLANDTAAKMLEQIERILVLTELQAGNREVSLEKFSIAELIESLVIEFKPHADEKHLNLTSSVSEDLKQPLYGDRSLIKGVCWELIDNAIIFTASGSVKIDVQTVQLSESAETCVQVSVTDTGSGIPKDKQQLIFEYFRQADGTSQREHDGLGIGLPIASLMTELLGGKLEMFDNTEQGSVFTFGFSLNRFSDHENI